MAKDELMTLADAIAILIELRDANKSQTEGTDTAVTQLGRFLRTAKFPRLTKPNLFLASADDADTQVLGILREVLAEYDSMVSVFDWQEIADAGAITSQIADRIVRSRYGICYFSEPDPSDAGHKYVDNPNVIFEAGMLHALINTPDARRRGGSRCARTTPRRPCSTSPTSASSGSPATRTARSTRSGSASRCTAA